MKMSKQYREFADECRRIAQQLPMESQRKMLEEMAGAWDRLAEEEEDEAASRETIEPAP